MTADQPRRRLLVLLVAGLLAGALLLGACSDDGGTTQGTGPQVSFGEGSIPESVPEDFPVPPGAVVGSTLVDRVNTRTEFEVRLRQEIADLAQYYTVNLVNAGFVIEDSSQVSGQWTLEFRRDGLTGSVRMTSPEPGVSQAFVTLDTA